MSVSSNDIGIDLGTANTLIYIKSKGIVLNEPTVIAVDSSSAKFVCAGTSAKQMLERTPKGLVAFKPISNGAVSDFDMTSQMLSYFIKKLSKHFFVFKPKAFLCIPIGLTAVEKRAVSQLASSAKLKSVSLVPEPMASAVGAGIDVYSPCGCMIADIGGGTTEIAVISLGGIVTGCSVDVGGDSVDRAIKSYIKNKYGVLIGVHSLEQMKISIATLLDNAEEKKCFVCGRNAYNGLPCSAQVSSLDIRDAIYPEIIRVIDSIKSVFEQTPPELCSDILKSGIVLSGGTALIKGIDKLIESQTGLKVKIAESPLESAAIGMGKMMEKKSKKKLSNKT